MIKVSVKPYSLVKEAIGKKEVQIEMKEGATVKDVLIELTERFTNLKGILVKGQDLEVQPNLILINGCLQPKLAELHCVQLNDGDTVSILTPIMGG